MQVSSRSQSFIHWPLAHCGFIVLAFFIVAIVLPLIFARVSPGAKNKVRAFCVLKAQVLQVVIKTL
jgi:hypothetical protein